MSSQLSMLSQPSFDISSHGAHPSADKIALRPYQQECVDIIDNLPPGAYLVQMATALGKTVTFSRIRRRGRTIILSHREELVRQPLKYFDCKTGVEMAGASSSPQDEVVSASVQSLVRRLHRFGRRDFDTLITDEAHHGAAESYQRIFDYFDTRLHVGFTATPNRGDKVRLDNVFQDIIFTRDLRWGIQNGYLSDVYCRRADIGYNLSAVRTRMGDYAPGELDKAMDGTADAIAEAYTKMATGATLIFAVSVEHAHEIAKRIHDAEVVTGETKNRSAIIEAFTGGKIPCLVNCMVFTEGTDIPRIETVIVARPTQSDTLYTQMVGRGLRLFPGKERLNLIDCVGVTGKASLCTAPSLLGVDMSEVPESKRSEVQGPLFDLPMRAMAASDCPESWIRNVQIVNLWAQAQKYQLHDVAWFKMPDGSLVLSLPEHKKLTISAQDELGRAQYMGRLMPMQEALDRAYRFLMEDCGDLRKIWDRSKADGWGRKPATDKQLELIRRRCKGFDVSGLNRGQASMILDRVTTGGKRA